LIKCENQEERDLTIKILDIIADSQRSSDLVKAINKEDQIPPDFKYLENTVLHFFSFLSSHL